MFEGFHDVSDDFYPEVFGLGGKVVGHVDDDDNVASVASLYLNPTPDPKAPTLERHMLKGTAFFDGAAVDPVHQGKGLYGQLIRSCLDIAHDYDRRGVATVVRKDNLQSLRPLLTNGYFVIANAPVFYGDRPQDDRAVGVNMFDAPNVLSRSPLPPELSDDGLAALPPYAFSIPVVQSASGDSINVGYNNRAGRILDAGYVGYACRDKVGASSREAGRDRVCLMSFALLGALAIPGEAQELLAATRDEVRAILAED
jgi:GNAT superfamily N-acetyltransferase